MNEQEKKGIIPVVLVSDIDTAKSFYIDFLDMTIVREGRDFLVLQYNEGIICLEQHLFLPEQTQCNLHIRIFVDNVKVYHNRAREKNIAIKQLIQNTSSGYREFIVTDPFGTKIRIAAEVNE